MMQNELISDFRLAMRRLAGGVVVITSIDGGKPIGMTATAVMSLSMDPPSVVIAVNRQASIARILSEGVPFAINLLGHAHQDFCERFSALPTGERFTVGTWEKGPGGVPFLPDAEAVVQCRVGPMHDFGSHRLVIGTVEGVSALGGTDPLIYSDGKYTRLQPPA